MKGALTGGLRKRPWLDSGKAKPMPKASSKSIKTGRPSIGSEYTNLKRKEKRRGEGGETLSCVLSLDVLRRPSLHFDVRLGPGLKPTSRIIEFQRFERGKGRCRAGKGKAKVSFE